MSISLLSLRTSVRQRADIVNNGFFADSELTDYINNSAAELYDILIEAHQEFAVIGPIQFSVTTPLDTNDAYTLPSDCYVLRGLDKQDVTAPMTHWIDIRPFNFKERNMRPVYGYAGTPGNFLVQYRWMGTELYLMPYLNSVGTYRFWYTPHLPRMVNDGDTLPAYMSGPAWHEYIITDAAIKCYQKQEDDASSLMAHKEALRIRIIGASATRDEGDTQRVADVYSSGYGDGWGGDTGRGWGWW